MRFLDWYFDFISPFAYLQQESFSRLPTDVAVRPRPVLLAGLLGHWGQKGPAEIPGKRRFTYRHVYWLAGHHGIPLRMPPAHPFNPLKPLRLAVALGATPEVVREIFRFIWRDGLDASSDEGLRALAARLGVADAAALIEGDEVKASLRANTDEAIARGVFGVPTFVVSGELFWGFDATGMLLDYLADPGLFDAPEWRRISELPAGVQRRL
ncbi:MAG TPA: 2-hydroxychromene-2-carboxylate isomerase [Candidatus Competibacteraceae bacterium]|nr:2-hydroxychromene-2-carboxylate isomerase [Candidatus Competibacteraceae bacterium]